MTRKKYINNMRWLMLAFYHAHKSGYSDGYKIGKQIRDIKINAPNVPKTFGSYENAWNCDVIMWFRTNIYTEFKDMSIRSLRGKTK